MPQTPPKALIFDLGGVIVPLDFKSAYSRLEGLCGIPAEEIPKRIAATGLVPRLECGEIEPRPFAEEILGCLGLPRSYDRFCELWSWIFRPGSLLPEAMFAALREQYRLVLLSNTNAIHWEMLEPQYPLLRHFHAHVLSYRVGTLKPSARIYREAVAEAGCRPEECFFTDDVATYVEGAKAEGIDAVQFRGPEQLEAELQARGVVWATGL